ncbi:hydrogenase maturation nickel metallochaperone HypA [Geomonas sp. Red69]|uniref:Hydrogenase maturation factor HypA n=1 Tax=Geomonas diazotrophica TaxID=2843197 RepID=A0ABX8JJG1_9BACT|nr:MULTISPECIES: hydrogenase maturation nickel metallochaperone HypA [Geomonas]MBU5636666.1 hydrogenase maturation nickel metallochaperone HypA [Geomonas diazotrophica]QWV98515.1 hydrogenase maturation nickel metallochaperone HypA [Geomonas nitrogeniifigens]QXE87698.1 hydrogenase maturation nickel metallochaperone HypA [Geomonas nitrogeniifigens]
MHEMSITQSVVEICEGHAAGRKVVEVVLEIGELSGVVPESVEFCFEACSKGTLLEGAKLTIEEVPGRGSCPACHGEFPLQSLFSPCPGCGAFGLSVVSGEELRVKELELA